MLELKSLYEISGSLEVYLSIIPIIISISIMYYVFKNKKPMLLYGFTSMTIWYILEALDNLFLKGIERELIFNIGGRVILIIGMIFFIIAFRSYKLLLVKKHNHNWKK